MRIVYLGTPDFAVLPLKKIAKRADDEIVAVITNPDKPVGRKRVLTPSPVKSAAIDLGIKVFTYEKIREEGVEDLKSLAPDIMITCAFGQILSQEILNIPKYGVINVHASLLPKYRGASPIHYAILNGEKITGITIMKTDVGIDTGDIMIKEEAKIEDDETCGELFERLSIIGANLLDKSLDIIKSGKAQFVPQNEEEATFTKMIKKEFALIDWNKSNRSVKNQVRAFNPAPVAYTFFGGEQIKIFSVELSDKSGKPAQILSCERDLIVACGEGSIIIKSLQKSGGKKMTAEEFLRGNRLPLGGFFANA